VERESLSNKCPEELQAEQNSIAHNFPSPPALKSDYFQLIAGDSQHHMFRVIGLRKTCLHSLFTTYHHISFAVTPRGEIRVAIE
jgi:hypothetical protein